MGRKKVSQPNIILTVPGVPYNFGSVSGAAPGASMTKDRDGGAPTSDILTGPVEYSDLSFEAAEDFEFDAVRYFRERIRTPFTGIRKTIDNDGFTVRQEVITGILLTVTPASGDSNAGTSLARYTVTVGVENVVPG